jgi:hypothetical protein
MKAYLINPFEKSITEVEHNGDYKQIYTFIDCDTFDVVRMDDGDGIYVDDEGLLKSGQQFFALPSLRPDAAFAGKGLVLGCDDQGDSTSPKITLDELAKLVQFPTLGDILWTCSRTPHETRHHAPATSTAGCRCQ